MISTETTKELQKYISNKPYLIWYSNNYHELSLESIIEHILNYGSWDDFLYLLKVLGFNNLKEVYLKTASNKRTNYHYLVRNYFNLFFTNNA